MSGPSARDAVWHGTPAEGEALARAIEAHCTCPEYERGSCAAHQMHLSQRTLDGLLFERHLVNRLRIEEFTDTPPPALGGTF